MKEEVLRCGNLLSTGRSCQRIRDHSGKCRSVWNHPETNRVWAAARRAWWQRYLGEYKLAKGCENCGLQDVWRHGLFHLDHVDRDNKIAPVSELSRRLNPERDDHMQRVLMELAKCQVLCTHCHAEKTSQDLAGDWNK